MINCKFYIDHRCNCKDAVNELINNNIVAPECVRCLCIFNRDDYIGKIFCKFYKPKNDSIEERLARVEKLVEKLITKETCYGVSNGN